MKGGATHTWELALRYHRCPFCGFILESREKPRCELGRYVKDLRCGRCHQFFQEASDARKTL